MTGKCYAGGYTVDTNGLATRIGELRALVDTVQSAADELELYGAELGPGDISSAVSDVADHWRDGLGDIADHIGTMADSVSNAVTNYETLEQEGADTFKREMAEQTHAMVAQAQQQQLGG
jgi:hypothetical protein